MAATPRNLAALAVLLTGSALMLYGARSAGCSRLDPSPNQQLLISTLYRDQAGVERALAQGAAVDARWKSGATALEIAAADGDLPLVRLLLAHGADVPNGEAVLRPLISATAKENATATQILLARGADPNLARRSGVTALKIAIESGRGDLVQLLRQVGATH